jgi:hypothetical protein
MPAIHIDRSIFNGIIATALEDYVLHPVDPNSIGISIRPIDGQVSVNFQPLTFVVSEDKATNEELVTFANMMLDELEESGPANLKLMAKWIRQLGIKSGIHSGMQHAHPRVSVERVLGLVLKFIETFETDGKHIDADVIKQARELLTK